MQDHIEHLESSDHSRTTNRTKKRSILVYLPILVLIGLFSITLLLWDRETDSSIEGSSETVPILADTLILVADLADEAEREALINEIRHILEPLSHGEIKVQTVEESVSTAEQSQVFIQQQHSPEQHVALLIWQGGRSSNEMIDWHITLDQRYLRFVLEESALPVLLEQPALLDITLQATKERLEHLALLSAGLILFQNGYYAESAAQFDKLSQQMALDAKIESEAHKHIDQAIRFYQAINLLALGDGEKAQEMLLALAPDPSASVQKTSILQLAAADNLALAALSQGNYGAAYQYQEGLLDLHELLDDFLGRGAIITNMGISAWKNQNTVAAQSRLEEGQEIFQQQLEGNPSDYLVGQGVIEEAFGRMASERGKQQDAILHYQQALDYQQNLGNLAGQLDILDHLLTISQAEEAWYEAKLYTRQKRLIFTHQNHEEQQAQMLVDLAEFAINDWQLDLAQHYYDQANALYEKNERFYEQAAIRYGQGKVAWWQGNRGEHRTFWQDSLKLYGQAYRVKFRAPSEQEISQRIEILRRFANMALWEDNVTLAVSYYQDLLLLYHQMEQPLKQADTLIRIAYLLQLFDPNLPLDRYFMFRPVGNKNLIEILPEKVMALDKQLSIAAIKAFEDRDYSLAKEYYQSILRLHEESSYLSSVRLIEVYNNLGVLHREEGRYIEARSDFEKAFELSIHAENVEAASVGLLNLSITSSLEGDEEMVQAYLVRITQMHEEAGIEISPDIQNAMEKL